MSRNDIRSTARSLQKRATARSDVLAYTDALDLARNGTTTLLPDLAAYRLVDYATYDADQFGLVVAIPGDASLDSINTAFTRATRYAEALEAVADEDTDVDAVLAALQQEFGATPTDELFQPYDAETAVSEVSDLRDVVDRLLAGDILDEGDTIPWGDVVRLPGWVLLRTAPNTVGDSIVETAVNLGLIDALGWRV